MSLRVGSQTTVVVTSASMAKEVLQTKDASFASRYVPDCLTAHDYHKFSMDLRPPDESWRLCRKFFTSHVFAKSKLDITESLRKQKVEDLFLYVETCSKTGEPVDIGQAAFTTTLNFISNTLFSIDLGDPNSEIAREFKINFTNLGVEATAPNMADIFPILKFVDPQRIKKRTATIIGKILMLIDRLISERMEIRKSTSSNFNNVLDYLLSLQIKEFQPGELRHLLIDLILGGTDTSAKLMEWAMAELMPNPEKMKKAQTELNEVIGKGNLLKEVDPAQLLYLQAVVKETMRLHAPVPFLLPRSVCQNIQLGDFIVPKNAQILVNVYAIHKDPTLWDNPDHFEPEIRFIGSSIDFQRHNFEYLPFGSGRRGCPGQPLATRMVHLMLGSLIHAFDWKFEDGVTPKTLDMKEKVGVSLHKAKRLCIIPVSK